MADKPGHYWDHHECRWVPSPARPDEVVVPAQAQPSDAPRVAPPADLPVRETPQLGSAS